MAIPRIYFSARELALITPALKLLVNRTATLQLGSQPWNPWLRITAKEWPGTYSHELASRVFATQNKLRQVPTTGGKLRLNVFELAACAFAVRTTAQFVRHGHAEPLVQQGFDPITAKLEVNVPKLLKKRERTRKKAKRAHIASYGNAGYKSQADTWRKHVQWMRITLTYCDCNRPALVHVRLSSQRLLYISWINTLTRYARTALDERGFQHVPTETARRFVRLAVAYARRRDGWMTAWAMLKNEARAKAYLYGFIEERLDRKPRRKNNSRRS